MKFFDERRRAIPAIEWVKLYEPQYFLGRPSNRIKNQGSRFVEDKVCQLLKSNNLLSERELNLIMAWKIGAIDHKNSERHRQIQYYYNWDEKSITRYGIDCSTSLSFLAAEMQKITNNVDRGDVKYLFELHSDLVGFGPVYILTILFFVTRGKYPIYDRFAHIAAEAVSQGLSPDSFVRHQPVNYWNDYEDYIQLVSRIAQACDGPPAHEPVLVSRQIDRALWVYGHFFETVSKTTQALADRTQRRSRLLLRSRPPCPMHPASR